MSTYSVFLGIGSNLGDRRKFLQEAVTALKSVKDTTVVWTSSVYESDPFGKQDQPKFLNAAVEIETTLPPDRLLTQLKDIEKLLGRSGTERWAPREIDIDILVYDGVVFQNEGLTVPHAGLEERRFVLVPLSEIAPDLVHPVSGMTMEELRNACRDSLRVVRTQHRLLV
jgi:2-amino-4-hydroxy-6-hydroxymethyldihydropteridine diphosphokinase